MEIQNLTKVDWERRRVLLTAQLADVYNCNPYRIKDNFSSRKAKFVEGVHYFKVSGEALRKLKRQVALTDPALISKYASELYLWTEEGCLLHCKMIDTDEAWRVFKELIMFYFAHRDVPSVAESAPVERVPSRKPISPDASVYAFDIRDDTMQDNLTKIGHSGDVSDRCERLRRESGLIVRAEHHSPKMSRAEARRIERMLHRKYAHMRVKGEFYRADFKEVSDELDRLVSETATVEMDLFEEVMPCAMTDPERGRLLVDMLHAPLDTPFKQELAKEIANFLFAKKIF